MFTVSILCHAGLSKTHFYRAKTWQTFISMSITLSGTLFLESEGTFLFHYLHMPFLFQETKKEQLRILSYDSTNADKINVGKMYQ